MKKELTLFIILLMFGTACQPRPHHFTKPARPLVRAADRVPVSERPGSKGNEDPLEIGQAERAAAAGEVFNGYTLFSPMGAQATYLIDNQGRVRHTWTSRYPIGSAVYLTDRGTLLRSEGMRRRQGTFSRGGGAGGILSEYDFNGNLLWQFQLNTDSRMLHHDFIELSNGHIMALSWEVRTRNGRQYWDERIIEIDKATREIVWEWRAMDHVRPDTQRADFLHFNSIDVEDNRILVSSRSQNEIWIIDKPSGQITLRYGQGLWGQHDATFLENGNILVFNNGRSRSAVTEIDPRTRTQVWQPDLFFFSSHISGAQRLPNGNTFVCVGESGKFLELDPKGDLVWQYQNPFVQQGRNGRAMGSVFNARKYSATLPAFLEHLSS